MPIFYNFYIFLATFYTIFGTNILIECPVPVPVCCMIFVSQKIHIKQSPNGIKTDRDFFWNICDFWEEETTRDDARGVHMAGGAPWALVATHVCCMFFVLQKIHIKRSPNGIKTYGDFLEYM